LSPGLFLSYSDHSEDSIPRSHWRAFALREMGEGHGAYLAHLEQRCLLTDGPPAVMLRYMGSLLETLVRFARLYEQGPAHAEEMRKLYRRAIQEVGARWEDGWRGRCLVCVEIAEREIPWAFLHSLCEGLRSLSCPRWELDAFGCSMTGVVVRTRGKLNIRGRLM
jgi:hypothetical protein